ncbi:MAG: hydroxyethylthiazole kinase [Pseudobutyrivibrio sp.]|nr:hydroxyethylthiazole kinase [Pseudobutyrivibrio sp.]
MREKTTDRKPLIHCITNPIAMNQSANAVLALGARPMMAEHPMEVAEITETAGGLLLNFGNISDVRMESMKISMAVANKCGIPVVIDVCGVACSRLRVQLFEDLMRENKATVIKGNYSEILALFDRGFRSSGVDAAEGISIDDIKRAAQALANKYDSMVLATGAVDILADINQEVCIAGGTAQMSTVTGTGCMLGAMVATFLAFDNSMEAVEKCVRFFNECGEKSETVKGGGTFMANLIDSIGEYDGF